MGWRFQRRVTIFPGLRANLSRRGVSFSVGKRGTSVTAGRRGLFLNLGIPGTGISWRGRISEARRAQKGRPWTSHERGLLLFAGLLWLIYLVIS